MDPVRLQPFTRARVESLGAAGRAWADGLPALLAELERRWSVRIGRSLAGGSAAYVARAQTADGSPRVVKVLVPDPELTEGAHVLAAARGRGYVRLYDHDPDRRALLLEALGPSLDLAELTVEQKLVALADTLRAAWTLDLDVADPVPPGECKASSLHRLVDDLDERLDHPTPAPVRTLALCYAERRAAAFDPAGCVVVHGDPHPANALRVLPTSDGAPRPGAESGWCFVDPDGFRADPAYDLGVVVRDWTRRLTGPDPRTRLQRWCSVLAERTGIDEQRIWEWGYLERVSTGLYLMSFGAGAEGQRYLSSAERLLAG